MDDFTFDAVARAVAAGASRRQALRLLAAGALTAWLPRRALAAPARQGTECEAGLTYCPGANGAFVCVVGDCVCGDLIYCNGMCADVATDPSNCGACGVVCTSGVCDGGGCTQGSLGCAEGLWDCEGTGICTSFLDDPYHCGDCGTVCASGVCEGGFCTQVGCEPGLVACPYSEHFGPAGCYDLATDPSRCGSCDNSCGGAGSRTIEACIEGSCVGTGCLEGFVDCDGSGYCTALSDDPNNCGACGIVCASGVCSEGVCTEDTTCAAGLTYCPALPPYAASAVGIPAGCTDLTSDYSNCGACGASCQPADPIAMDCIGGQCTQIGCVLGWTDCGNLECTQLHNDPLNCGECGNVCESGVCEGGECVPVDTTCAAGLTYCPVKQITVGFDNQPDEQPAGCYDLSSDRIHCGACDITCPTTVGCYGGECGLPPCDEGLTRCAVGCVDLDVDPDNCGECENACDSGVCAAGMCGATTSTTDEATRAQEARGAGGATDATTETRPTRTPRTRDTAPAPGTANAAQAAIEPVLAWPFDANAGQWTIVHGYRAEDEDTNRVATPAADPGDFARVALEFAVCPAADVDAAEGICDLGATGSDPSWDREATQGSAVLSPVDGTVVWTDGEASCLALGIDIAGHAGYRLALYNVEGDLERGQHVTRGKRIGKVAGRGCERGDRLRMALYQPQKGTSDDPVAEREGVPFTGDWAIAGCEYPDDGRTVEQYREELVPCPSTDGAPVNS